MGVAIFWLERSCEQFNLDQNVFLSKTKTKGRQKPAHRRQLSISRLCVTLSSPQQQLTPDILTSITRFKKEVKRVNSSDISNQLLGTRSNHCLLLAQDQQ